MPQVQYVDQVNKIRLTKRMATPKRITSLTHWFKGARKAIPEIPDALANNIWHIEHQSATVEWVRFDLRHNEGHRVYVVIFRNQEVKAA